MEESNYKIGEVYPFKVKAVFNDHCELEDGDVTAYLHLDGNEKFLFDEGEMCVAVSYQQIISN